MTLMGMHVYESSAAYETTAIPVRALKHHRWHNGRVYFFRVQKKWTKRYGYKIKPVILKTATAFFVHPTLMPEIRKLIADERAHMRYP